jgi:hypothetical protein
MIIITALYIVAHGRLLQAPYNFKTERDLRCPGQDRPYDDEEALTQTLMGNLPSACKACAENLWAGAGP